MAVRNGQALGAALNDLLATETRGLSRHLREATPYLTAVTYPIWADVQKMLSASAHHARRLSDLLDALELGERPASFQLDVARFHYTQLSYLLPLLIEEKQSQIAAYRQAIEHAAGEPLVTDPLNELLADVQDQLVELQQHHEQIKKPTGA
jgi:hypothetical protein